ncbi:MAG TPA: type II 3-dehydroquinate dehydratase [bacterium]
MRFLVLQGPNLNLFGRREPHIYGTMTLGDINARIKTLATELKVDVAFIQSNHEGDLVDFLHENMDRAQGAILNPAALTQYGVSLHDAIKAMPFPVIEVHMSNLAQREEWRHRSIISPAVKGTVQGFNWRSYTAAFRLAVEMAQDSQGSKKTKAAPKKKARRR